MTEKPTVSAQASFGESGDIEGPDSFGTDLEDYGADVDNRDTETKIDRPEASGLFNDDRPADDRPDIDPGEQCAIAAESDENQKQLNGETGAETPPKWE